MGLIITYHMDSWEDIKRDHLLQWLASCLEHDRYTMNTEHCLDVIYLFQNQTMFLHNCQMCKHFLVTRGTWQGAGGEGWGWRDWGAGSILVTSSCGRFLIFNLRRTAPSLVYNSHSYNTEEGNGIWLQIQLKIVFPSSHNPHTALKPLSSTDSQFSLLSMGLPLLGRWAAARGQAGPWTEEKREGTHLSWNLALGSPESHGLPTFLVFLLGFEAIPTPQETPRFIWPTLFALC